MPDNILKWCLQICQLFWQFLKSAKVTKLRNLTKCTHSRRFSPYKNTFPTSFLKFKSQDFQCKQNFLTLAITEPAAQKAEYCIDRARRQIYWVFTFLCHVVYVKFKCLKSLILTDITEFLSYFGVLDLKSDTGLDEENL
jgi:hypothetical protein